MEITLTQVKDNQMITTDLTKIKDEKKANQDLSDALTMIDASGLEHDEKEALRQKVKNGEASLNAVDKILNGKGAINARKEAEEAKSAQHVFDELSGLVNEVGRTGAITGNLGLGKTGKAYAKFTSLTGGLESALVEMVNRGTLSNVRFKYITETLLPKPHDTQEQIRGKLEGLAELLELDSSALTGKKQESKIDKNIASLPDASRFPKKTIKSPDGEKYYSDGTKWVKK